MESILKKSYENGFTYKQYRDLVSAQLAEGKSTGHQQSEALLHYSQLNEARLNRLDKTMVVTEQVLQQLQNLPKKYLWLVISEGWCGDAAQIVPIINKMAEASDKVALRIVLRDDNPGLMDLFLTNGSRSIPMLIIMDAQTHALVAQFGPRPQAAKQLIADYKAEHGVVDEPAKVALQKWYLNDKGVATQNEIMALLA